MHYILIIRLPNSTIEIPYDTIDALKEAVTDLNTLKIPGLETTPIKQGDDNSWEIVDFK